MPDKIIKKINYNGDEYIVGVQTTATTSEAGLMSAGDKEKLDNMTVSSITGTSPIVASTSDGATTISHSASGVTAGSKGDTSAQTPNFGGTFKVTSGTVNATGHMTAFAEHTVTIPNNLASTTEAGLMSKDDKAKLDSIAEGAQANSVTGVKGNSESTYRTGNVNITKANIGLGNVENKSSATIRGELTSSNVTTALGYTPATQDTASTTAAGLMSKDDKEKLDNIAENAEVNQNAFSNIKVGATTVAADSKTDTVELVGNNVTLTPDATNDKVTIGITKANVTNALGYTPPTQDTTYSTATTTTAGLMSPTDKQRVDNLTVFSITGTSPINANTDDGVATISHANSGVTANTYGVTATTALTPGFGSTFSVPGIQVNATGHITAAGAHTVKIPDTLASSSTPGLMSKTDKSNFDSGLTIAGNTLAIGGTITADTLRTSLGLSSAMHFIGIATVAITDGSTTNPTISGYDFGTNGVNATAGDVVIDKDSSYEYVWTGIKWERLGPDGSYALADHTHATATTGANGFMSKEDKQKLDNMLVSSITGSAPISASTTDGVATISHDTSGVTANTYGVTATSAVEPAFGATFSVPGFTVNNTGHITAAGAHTVKIPATLASTTAAGLMSKDDKSKLDNVLVYSVNGTAPISVTTSNNVATIAHATSGPSSTASTSKGDTSNQTPGFGSTFKVTSETVDKFGHTTALAEHTVTIPNTLASTNANGLMSIRDKSRLDNMADNATNTTIAATSPIIASASTGAVTITHYTAGPNATATTSKGQNSDLSVNTSAPMSGFKFGDTFKSAYVTTDKFGHTTALTESTVQIPNYTATNTYNGLMSFSDKDKLDHLSDEYIQKSVLAHTNSLIYASAANTPAELEANMENVTVDGNTSSKGRAWLMSGGFDENTSLNNGELAWVYPTYVSVVKAIDLTSNIPTWAEYNEGVLTIQEGEPASINASNAGVLSNITEYSEHLTDIEPYSSADPGIK